MGSKLNSFFWGRWKACIAHHCIAPLRLSHFLSIASIRRTEGLLNTQMASTRFHDDPARVIKQLEMQTAVGRWALETPFPMGDRPCFPLDPQIIPQKWGANTWSNATDISSELKGLGRPARKRDCFNFDPNPNPFRTSTSSILPPVGQHSAPLSAQYGVCTQFLTTEQSRAVTPAWTLRDSTPADYMFRTHLILHNPQTVRRVEMPFDNNIDTRAFEKEMYVQGNCDFKHTFPTLPIRESTNGDTVPVSMRVRNAVPYSSAPTTRAMMAGQ